MDVVVLIDYSVQVIELNPFGSYMSSGSALFNWNQDYDILYGKVKQKKPNMRILTKQLS